VATALSTFLITDIEASTRLWEEHAEAMATALAAHDHLLRGAVESSGGSVIKTTGDGLLAIFGEPLAAVSAALTAERAIRDATWGETGPLRVRIAINSGSAESRDGDFFGPALNRAARILAIGHGGQVLLSAVAAALARERLESAIELRDLGSHRLRDLDRPEQIFQLVAPDLRHDFPPLRSLSTRRSNLPVLLTSFVGRERELNEVEALVKRHRLVTLVGTGGTGKTRLMLEAAGRIGDRFHDGAWLAELAPLGDPSQIGTEIARALGVPEEPGQSAIETVQNFVAAKDLLLLVDNAEHLVDGVASVAERLLAAAPGLRIVATSREALAVPGEAVLQVRSLACPMLVANRGVGPDSAPDLDAIAATEAVRLFTDRASSVLPEFELNEGNVVAVAEICRRLDGIPLAIELAAARVSSMSAQDISVRLGDRFRLLTGGRRTAVPRQQTLHALIDWSWDLLTEDDRRLLRRLSVFAGGWTAELAAGIVVDDPAEGDELALLEGLARLVDRSLVMVDRGATTRYRMLETIRQYARERLIQGGEATAVADRHFAAFARLAAAAEPELRGPAMGEWLDRLDADAENLGVALEWGLEAAPWEAVRMCTAMLAYWSARVASADSEARVTAAIEIARARTLGCSNVDPAEQALAARLLGEAARIWAMAGRPDLGLSWAEDAVPLARASGDVAAILAAVSGLAISSAFSGRGEEVRGIFEEAAEIAAASGTWWVLAMSAGFSGATIAAVDPEAGAAMVGRAQEAARRSRNPFALGAVAVAQGRVLGLARRPDEAAASFGEAIQRFSEIGDTRFALAARSDMAHALRRGGRLDDASALYRETLAGWLHLGNRGAVANQLENVGYVAIERGQLPLAAQLLGAAEAIRETAASRIAIDEEPELRAYLGRLREAVPAEELSSAWDAGRALLLAEAVTVARESVGPSGVH
jgi:predicted ATPase/class 3 adenylate cyclase